MLRPKQLARAHQGYKPHWHRLFTLGILLFVPACCLSQALPKPVPVPRSITPIDQTIYALVLSDAEVWNDPVSAGSVKDHTVPDKYGYWDYLEVGLDVKTKTLLNRASLETRDDFYAKKSRTCYLGHLDQDSLDRTDAKSNRAHRPSKPEYWHGVIQLSRIGFNEAKNEAIVYTVSECGATCGMGDLFLLRLVDGRWTIVGFVNIWVS